MKAIRHLSAIMSLAVAACGTAMAAPDSDYKLNFLITLGHSNGGAKLMTLDYTDGTSQNLKAGGGNFFGVGGLAQLTRYPVDLSLTIGAHTDKDHASNAEIRFSRIPIEAIPYLRLNSHWRAGAGIRYLAKNKFSADIKGVDYGSITFKRNLGLVFDTDYWFNSTVGFGFRYVNEKIKTDDPRLPIDADGSHWSFSLRAKF